MNKAHGKQDAFIRLREVVCGCPNAWYWRNMAPELKPKYFMPYWSEARLRRHLEMLKAFGFNSLQISFAPQVALNSGVDQSVWNERVRYMCRTARGLGLRVSQFVWGSMVYDFDKKGCVTLDWHNPGDRARLAPPGLKPMFTGGNRPC
ncbi:MAG: hypothetical protein PHW60_00965 [Kiritimatiellae bacterium]|nr:hypothetical protein [Kiritimatiellia bacterium]